MLGVPFLFVENFMVIIYSLCFKLIMIRETTNQTKIARAPSEDTDQPGHPPSLIRVFAVCIAVISLSAHSADSDQTDLSSLAHIPLFCFAMSPFLSGLVWVA